MRIEGSLRALLGSVALVAAIAGCVSAPSPRPSVELEGAIARTRARLLAEDPAWAAETEDFFGALVESAWRVAHAARYLDAPEFQPGRGIVGLPGLFNPDNRYTSALLDPNGAYRISGTRGTHALLSLQFLAGYPLVELSKGLDVIDLDAEGIAAGEEFDFWLGGDPAEAPDGRWRPLPENARAVLARQTFDDWTRETPSRLQIERLDPHGRLPDGPSHAALAADYLDQATALWADGYLAGLARLPENTMPPIRASGNEAGGLSGQQGVIMRYRLAPGEALLVTLRKSTARYQSIQLGNRWFATQNPVRFQSSLSLAQAHADADGMLRFVISDEDPGVHNWLATAGAARGYLMIRWQGLTQPLDPTRPPSARVVSLDALDAALPEDTRRVTPAERAEQLTARRALPALKD